MPQPALPHLDGVTHHFTDVGGHRLHWASAGDLDAPPLVLVHGWPQHWFAWRHQITALAGERRIIAVDLRGHGWSDAPAGSYAKADLAADLVRLLDELVLERVDLAGHDWGGWTSLLVGLDHPDRIRRMVLCSIGLPWTRPTPGTIRHLWRFWYQWGVATPFVGPAAIRAGAVARVIRHWGGEAIDEAALASFDEVLRQPGRARMSSRMYRTFTLRELPRVIAGQFHDRVLEVPTLVLFGTADTPLHPDLMGNDPHVLSTAAPNLEVELVEGVDHFLLEERADLVTDRLRTFLADWPSTA